MTTITFCVVKKQTEKRENFSNLNNDYVMGGEAVPLTFFTPNPAYNNNIKIIVIILVYA